MRKFLIISLLPLYLLCQSESLASNKTYLVGVYDNKPIIFKDTSGKLSGISIDVLESVASDEDIEFVYTHGHWKDMLAALEKGELDLLVGMAYSEERAKKFDFINEALINNWGVIYRNRTVSITSLEDLKGKRIALLEGSIHTRVFTQIMQQFRFNFEAVLVESYLDGMRVADEGKADAVVINRVISLLNSREYEVLETGIIFNPVEVRMAAPKGKNSRLLSLVDKHLSQQKLDKNSAYHKSLAKWFNSPSTGPFPQWLLYIIGIILLIWLVMAISLFAIRRQVRIKTAALSESELRFRQIAENINEIFWIGSPDWQEIYYVSPTYEKIWGDSRENLYSSAKCWLDFVHPDDRQLVIDDLNRKAAGDLSNPAFPLYRIISGNGETRWISARAYPVRDDQDNITRITGVAEDITDRKEVEDQMRFMAMHDPLTKLLNRFAFEKHFNKIIHQDLHKTEQYALLYIDLDQFKIVNDTCGHTAGDKMLSMLAESLNDFVNGNGIIARLGGDEFGIILKQTSIQAAQSFAQELLKLIKGFQFTWGNKRFSVGASIGLVMIDDYSYNEVELLSAADMACYAAKEMGRNRIHTFTHDDKDMLQRHGEMKFVERINHALEEDRFILHRQIISSLQTDDVLPTYEYLIRLLDEDGKLLYPDTFIPAAERYELMIKIDRWVVTHVFKYLYSQSKEKSPNNAMPVAFINLSGQAFSDNAFPGLIIKTAQQYRIDPQLICFEITETTAISNLNLARDFINKLRLEGFKFALDDFGTGMSSFSYLRSLHVDFLKIDGIFIQDLDKDELNSAIIEAITNIGHKSDLKVIAEWIETQSAKDMLILSGVDFGQGYAIGRPEGLPDITNLKIAK